MMKYRLLVPALLAFAGPLLSREIIPGVVSFDEPAGVRSLAPHHDPGDNPFTLSQTIASYQPPTNSARSFSEFDIGVRIVGGQIGPGKRVIFRSLTEDELKRELLGTGDGKSLERTLDEVTVSNHKAYRVRSKHAVPAMRPDAILYNESYYISFEPNRGITLTLSSDSEEGLAALRQWLPRINIPKEPKLIPPPPKPEPTVEEKKKAQIIRNLSAIYGAGDQSQLMYNKKTFTFAELRRDFADALDTLQSVDGETYNDLVWVNGKPLVVKTKTLGTIEYLP